MIKPLDARAYDTDKAKMTHYLRYYEQWFESLWDQPITLLELGIHKGGSMLLWRDYFTKGTIVGLDFNRVNWKTPPAGFTFTRAGSRTPRCSIASLRKLPRRALILSLMTPRILGEFTRTSFWHLFDHHLKPGRAVHH